MHRLGPCSHPYGKWTQNELPEVASGATVMQGGSTRLKIQCSSVLSEPSQHPEPVQEGLFDMEIFGHRRGRRNSECGSKRAQSNALPSSRCSRRALACAMAACNRCCKVFLVRKCLGKLNHAMQVLHSEAAPEFSFQMSPQCGDNLSAILCSPLGQNVPVNARANLPIEMNQGAVYSTSYRFASLGDQRSQIGKQFCTRRQTQGRLRCRSF
jgi:hypothetical protein